MNTIKELTQQEKYNTMLKRKNRKIKSLKEQLELLVNDDEKYQETIIRQSKRIDKAIEFIGEGYKYSIILNEIIDILKGKDE